ncbi:YDG/SRA domain-containing protein [Spirillospora sp. NPDC047279]|uniref:caspase, EACC1-associated type n=1 Tax=Spirillospora sp. NPDC047279 TaxID=3155478 RepID=UPI0033E7CBB3
MLIGTGAYDVMPQLPAVYNNLLALKEALCLPAVWGLPPQHCQVVQDPRTQREMIDPVRQAAEEARKVLLVYFAGHGVRALGGELFLGLPETVEEPSSSFYTAVPYEYLRNVLRGSRAQYRIVILDCCFSGQAIGTMGGSDVASQTEIEGTFIMASAPPNSRSLAPEGARFTSFSHELIEILQHGIADADRLLSLDTVVNHIKGEMRAKALPLPWSQDRNDAGRLTLFRNRAFATSSAPPGYGEIPGIGEGELFANRRALHDARVHRPLQAGICGTHHAGGAESIVVSGGYPDDEDYGDVIIYTGHGGQDPNTHRQVKDQEPADPGNAALLASITTRNPVRVIRGEGGDPRHSPEAGFSYDGLYTVEEYWTAVGVDGYKVIRFRLEKLNEKTPPVVPTDVLDDRPGIDIYRWERVARGIYLDRRIADKVKQAHDYECQVCGLALQTPAGHRFAEIVHPKSLAVPHRGPDVPENILCVCPTHRVQLELGTITIDDQLRIINEVTGLPDGELRTSSKHRVGREYLRYHRDLYHQAISSDALER